MKMLDIILGMVAFWFGVVSIKNGLLFEGGVMLALCYLLLKDK